MISDLDGKQVWKPGTFIYPVPSVMVSCGNKEGIQNIITVSWTGTICTEPAMNYVSIRKERFSHSLIQESGEFVINLTTEALSYATDFCGVKSGRDCNKFSQLNLTPHLGNLRYAPYIKECPVSIECIVTECLSLGSHDMFMARVLDIIVDEKYMDENGKFHFAKANPICYSHGNYFGIKEKPLGHFGYSVRRNKKK